MRAAMIPPDGANAHAGSRPRVTSMGGLYDAATLRAPVTSRRQEPLYVVALSSVGPYGFGHSDLVKPCRSHSGFTFTRLDEWALSPERDSPTQRCRIAPKASDVLGQAPDAQNAISAAHKTRLGLFARRPRIYDDRALP